MGTTAWAAGSSVSSRTKRLPPFSSAADTRSPGGGAFLGLAAYSYYSGRSQLEQNRATILQSKSVFGMRSRQMGITGISLALAWMGLWRLFR